MDSGNSFSDMIHTLANIINSQGDCRILKNIRLLFRPESSNIVHTEENPLCASIACILVFFHVIDLFMVTKESGIREVFLGEVV